MIKYGSPLNTNFSFLIIIIIILSILSSGLMILSDISRQSYAQFSKDPEHLRVVAASTQNNIISVGPIGSQSKQGVIGKQGSAGPTPVINGTLRYVNGSIVPIIGTVKSIATCNPNEVVVGGGFNISGGFGIILDTSPIGKFSWVAVATTPSNVYNNNSIGNLQAGAMCLKHQGVITVIKHVVGGNAHAWDFIMGVTSGCDGTEKLFPGTESGTPVTLGPTTCAYSITERGSAIYNYTYSFSGDCGGYLNPGDKEKCVWTNTYVNHTIVKR